MRIFGGRKRGHLLCSGPMKRNNQTNEKVLAHARGANPEAIHPATEPVCGFGRKRMPYPAVMECMAGTPVYSVRTSSLPLAQLMRPSPDLDGLLEYVETILDVEGPEPERFERFLEYPTWPRDPETGRAIGRPSMSDAMLLGAHLRIAVEGKWTEPHFGSYQTVEDWIREDGTNVISRKPDVLEAWIAEVRAAGALRRGATAESLAHIPYQLVHRTASACHRAGLARGVLPVLCYVVFRDPDATPDEFAATKDFENGILGQWTDWLAPSGIEVLVISVPVIRTPAPRSPSAAARLFQAIGAGKNPYQIDWNGICLRIRPKLAPLSRRAQ